MKGPPPGISIALSLAAAGMIAVYYITEIIVLKRPAAGPYPYWTSVSGYVLMVYLAIKTAEECIWISLLTSISAFVVGFIMILSLWK